MKMQLQSRVNGEGSFTAIDDFVHSEQCCFTTFRDFQYIVVLGPGRASSPALTLVDWMLVDWMLVMTIDTLSQSTQTLSHSLNRNGTSIRGRQAHAKF